MPVMNPELVGSNCETTDQVPSETSINVPTAQWLADNGSNSTHVGVCVYVVVWEVD